ncbi:copia protein [Tanacetum coccineum]
MSPGGGPLNKSGPHIVKAPPRAIMGPPVCSPGFEKSVPFQKSILGPRPKHIMVNKVKVPVASDNEVKQFYKPSLKPEVGFSKPNFRSKTSPPRRVNNNYPRPRTPQPRRNVGRQNQPYDFPEERLICDFDENSTLWHRRLGHANMRLIQSLASNELVINLPKLKFDQHFCDACKIGKQAHASHKAKNIVSTTRCLILLHMDLFGPSIIRSYGGNRHTLVIVDDYSRIEIVVYADSDHAGDYVDRKSTSGICTFVGCCLISLFSKKQTALAISTTEAEYVSAEKPCQQAEWMKQALIDYDVRLNDVPIMCDNKSAIDLSKNPMQHSQTKHIKICHHFLRDNVQKGHISIEKVPSVDNIADILPKPLKRESFNYLRLGLGMMEHIP